MLEQAEEAQVADGHRSIDWCSGWHTSSTLALVFIVQRVHKCQAGSVHGERRPARAPTQHGAHGPDGLRSTQLQALLQQRPQRRRSSVTHRFPVYAHPFAKLPKLPQQSAMYTNTFQIFLLLLSNKMLDMSQIMNQKKVLKIQYTILWNRFFEV